MSVRIPPLKPESASKEQREALEKVKAAVGNVPALFGTFGHAPNVLSAVMQFQAALAQGGLTRRDRELIDLHVSQLNGCGYCVSAHTVLGRMSGLTDEEMLRARDGHGETPRDAAVLALSRRVVRTGGLQAAAEVAQAREAGLSDAQIVEIVAATALRSLVTAVALVSGVELDFPRAPRTPGS